MKLGVDIMYPEKETLRQGNQRSYETWMAYHQELGGYERRCALCIFMIVRQCPDTRSKAHRQLEPLVADVNLASLGP